MKKLLLSNSLLGVILLSHSAFAGITLTKSDFKYLGAFRVPHGVHGEGGFGNNPFVNAQFQPLTYNPVNNSIYLGKTSPRRDLPKGLGEISIPDIVNPLEVGLDVTKLKSATVIQNIQDISNGEFDRLRRGGELPELVARGQLGGFYVYQGVLYGTAWSYYDASGANGYRSHWTANVNWSRGTGFSGLHAVGESPNGSVANGGFVGGAMAEIPNEYKDELGFPMLTGRSGGPIISRSSYGPTFWGFDPSTFNYDTPARAQMFIGYDSNHQTLGKYNDTPSLYFTMGTGVGAIIWPEGSDSIFAFGSHGFGIEHDASGMPMANSSGACIGPGTSYRSEARTNQWLKDNAMDGYACGYTNMTSTGISEGEACCFDPEDPSNKTHNLPYSVGYGQSCYGPGTDDWSIARKNSWLVANSSSGYDCDGHTVSANDISEGNGCCYRGSGSLAKGGSAYPSVYQVWQYDVKDLIAVKNGSSQPYEIIPEVWNFDLPLDPDPSLHPKGIIGVTYDKTRKRVYVGQTFGDDNYPLIHVFEITKLIGVGPSPEPPSGLKVK